MNTSHTQNCYKKIALNIAKHHPSIFLKAFPLESTKPAQNESIWKEYPWFDKVVELIDRGRDLLAGYEINEYMRNSDHDEYEYVTIADARSIVTEIKSQYLDPQIPFYSQYCSVGKYGYIVQRCRDDYVIGRGLTKNEAALNAWDWHSKHTTLY